MAFVNLASFASQWRGYTYYENRKVRSCRQAADGQYEGMVSGSNGMIYQVKINLEHPRSSQCTCPHAAGKRIVCKHMVALYFTAFPDEAETFHREYIEAEEEAEREREDAENALIAYISKMKKADLQEALLQVLFDGPEWQYDRFLEEYLGRF